MRLPQEIAAEELWLEWFMRYGNISRNRTKEILKKHNLKLRKSMTDNDLDLLLGRAFKKVCGTHDSVAQREAIAEEIDRICTIARWDFEVARRANWKPGENLEKASLQTAKETENDYER